MVEVFKKEAGVKYCSQCGNGGWDYEAGEGPDTADWFVKGYLHHWTGKKVPYRAYLCDAHTTDGNLHDEFDPVFKTMKPITLSAWETELKYLEDNNAGAREIEFAMKRVTALGGTYYYPDCDWEYWGKKDRNGNKMYHDSKFPIYGKNDDGNEYLQHRATMREDASKHTWLDLEKTFPNCYMKEWGTGNTKTFKEIVESVIPSIKLGRMTSKEWAGVKMYTDDDPFNLCNTIMFNINDQHGYYKAGDSLDNDNYNNGHWVKVPNIPYRGQEYAGYQWSDRSRVLNPESNAFIQDKENRGVWELQISK